MENLIKGFVQTGDVASTQVGNIMAQVGAMAGSTQVGNLSEEPDLGQLLGEPYVKNVYWTHLYPRQGSPEPYYETKIVNYGGTVYIYGVVKNYPKYDPVTIYVVEKGGQSKAVYNTSVSTDANGAFIARINLSEDWYKKNTDPNKVYDLSIIVHHFGTKRNIIEAKFNRPLEIDIVTTIPDILANRNMITAANCQREWFKRKGLYGPENSKSFVTNILRIDWAKEFSAFNRLYNTIFEGTEPVWRNQKARNGLVSEIQKMIDSKICSLPNDQNPVVDFGVFTFEDVEIIYRDGRRMIGPHIEQYYYVAILNSTFESIRDGLTEFLAAVGRCTIHIAAKGTIAKVQISGTPEYEIHIQELGIYIRDGFDFTGSDQFLGYWNPKINQMGILPVSGKEVRNSTYNRFRERTGMGGDFYNYSDLDKVPVDYKFRVPFNALSNRA